MLNSKRKVFLVIVAFLAITALQITVLQLAKNADAGDKKQKECIVSPLPTDISITPSASISATIVPTIEIPTSTPVRVSEEEFCRDWDNDFTVRLDGDVVFRCPTVTPTSSQPTSTLTPTQSVQVQAQPTVQPSSTPYPMGIIEQPQTAPNTGRAK